MKNQALLESLVYLDKGYIADLYEVVTGKSPSTVITRNQGAKADVQIPIFSAGISAQETRAFPVSTLQMLVETLPDIEKRPALDPATFEPGMKSKYGWVEGELTVFKVTSKTMGSSNGTEHILGTDSFFHLRPKPGVDYALITTPDYFSLGLDAFLRMQDTLIKEMSLPVRAYIRTLAAQSHTKQWVAVPLVILER